MDNFCKAGIVSLLLCIAVSTIAYPQCTGETYTVVNQCPNQQPQVKIDGAPVAGTNYYWFDIVPPGSTVLPLGQGYNIVYPSPLTGPETFYYQKQVSATGGPTALPGPYANPGAVPSGGDVYDMTVTSTVDYLLNYVTVAIHSYSCGASDEFRLKVQAGTQYSQWHYFKCTDMIATSNSNIKLVRVPLYRTVSELGLPVLAGSSTITIHTAADGTEKAGTKIVDAFEWYNAASFTNTYTIGTAPSNLTINYGAASGTISGQSNKVPGLFDWNVTLLCPPVPVTVTPNSAGCCVPANVIAPVITSSSGSNIVNTDPIVPAITLSTPLQAGYYYRWYKDGVALGGANEGTNVNSISVSSAGKYTVQVAETNAFIDIYSCTKDNMMWVQKRQLFAEANKTSICLGESVELLAKGATGPVTWTPPTDMTNPATATPVFTPTAIGSYPLSVTGEVPVGNQIINGDFEAGNVQINPSTYYTYLNPAGAGNTTPSYAIGYPSRKNLSIGVGNYTINEYVFWPGFQAWLPCADHTTGSGKFLYTDASGANAPGTAKYLWSQDVVVQPGINYEFAAWVMNFNAEGDAGYVAPPGVSGINVNVASNPMPQLMLYINDVPAFATTPTLLTTVGLWQKISTVWNSGTTSGIVKLKLAEIFPGPATGGHDFGLDDISFGAPGYQTDNISINVTDCNVISATVSGCTGDSVTLTATTNGVFMGWTNTTLSSPSTSTIGIRNPASDGTKAKAEAGVSTHFTATAKFIFGNSIVNGDFSQFKTGFSSTYSEVTNPGGSGMNPGQFAVGVQPTAVDNTFFVNKNDHTTNTANGQYFIGDSRYDATRSVAYRTSVSVVNGEEYGFSGWFANIHKEFLKTNPDTLNTAPYPNGGKTTHLALYVNNVFVKRIDLPLDTAWHNYTATWLSNTTGTVNLELRSLNIPFASIRSGFVMDDLKFGKTITQTKSVEVIANNCVLPVEYLSFSAVREASRVLLKWQTASEQNSQSFIVQRSTNGIDFEDIATLPAAGNSAEIQNYVYYDELAPSGLVYYRLKQTDNNGEVHLSEIRVVKSKAGVVSYLYPNPSNEKVWLLVDSDVPMFHLKVSTCTGGIIAERILSSNMEHEIGAILSSGMYILEIAQGDYQEMIRLIRY